MKKLKLGIIGVGHIAQVGYIPVLKKMEQAELYALCDIDEPKLYKAQEIHKVPVVYTDFEAILEDKNIDGILVLTPNHLHTPMAMASLEFGKNVLVEKPMSINLIEANFLKEKVEEHKNLVFLLGLNNRFRPDLIKLKEIVDKKIVGEIYHIECGYYIKRVEFEETQWKEERESGGGVLNLQGVQLLEILFHFFPDKKPEKIISSLYYEDEEKAEKEAFAFFKINGVSVKFEISWNPEFKRDYLFFNLHGEKGIAYLNPFKVIEKRYGSVLEIKPEITEEESFFKISFHKQLEHFVRCIKNKERPKFGLKEGYFLTEIIEEIRKSAG